MKLQERGEPRAGLAKSASVAVPLSYRSGPLTFVRKAWVIAEWEARKIRHDATDLVTRAIQPLLWLIVFGETFTRIRAIPTGNVSYLSFLAPGILAQSVLFISIFAGIAIIWERDLGVIHKFLASPTPRVSLVVGKGLASGIRALPQAIVIYIVAILLGANMQVNPLCILGTLVMAVLGAACFSTFSLIIACLLKTRDRVMGIGQVLTMPLFFASNAIYPIEIMPQWLRVIATINPLTYVVGALRTLMLPNTTDYSSLFLDFGVLLGVTIVLVAIGAALYPRIVQ
ncbi:MAG TPA: ABC transporter permease [Ktedonobacteraceae bacterium]